MLFLGVKKKKGSLLSSYFNCVSGRVLSQVNKSLTWTIKRESQGPSLSFRTQVPLNEGRLDPLETGPCYSTRVFLSPILSQSDLWPLPWFLWTRENKWLYLIEIAGHCLWTDLTLTPGKCHCGPCVSIGAYGGQMLHGVFAQVYLTVGPLGPRNTCGYFPRPGIHNWDRHA